MWLHAEIYKIAEDFLTTAGNNVISVLYVLLFYEQCIGQRRLHTYHSHWLINFLELLWQLLLFSIYQIP